MTGIAFLKRLSFQLDFLNEVDQKTVISFYERKLANANTLLEEEAIVKSFGSPEHIAKTLKSAYMSHLAVAENEFQTTNEVDDNQNSDHVDDMESGAPVSADVDTMSEDAHHEEADDDIIFSKPSMPKKSAEMIHSLENKEVKTLYGEKVVIEDRSEPIEEFIIEPIDNENGLTEEEIRLAKEETLEKANSFTTASIEIPPELLKSEDSEKPPEEEYENNSVPAEQPTSTIAEEPAQETKEDTESTQEEANETLEKTTVVTEEKESALSEDNSEVNNDSSSSEITEETKEESVAIEVESEKCSDVSAESEDPENSQTTDEMIPVEKKPGIITRLFPASMSKGLRVFLSIILSVIVSPVLLIVFGVGILSYAVSAVAVLIVALLAFALIAAMIIFGIAELIYGFSSLFDTVSIALIEIGIGTVVFGIVTAIAALIYEFLFGVVPRAIKALTKLFVMYLKKVSSFLYGGNA